MSNSVSNKLDGHQNKKSRGISGANPTHHDEEERPDRPASPTNPTIDEPDSRPRRPLPLVSPALAHAMNSTPFVFPDPTDMSGLPTLAHENPHIQLTRNGTPPEVLPEGDRLAIPFTNAVFPRIAITFGRLTRNMPDDVVERLGAGELAVVPFGAGADLYNDHPHLNRDVLNFLHSLIYDTTNIEVAMPVAKYKPKKGFDGPFPMILTGCSQDLTAFLLWHQTFAINDKLTFNVFPFNRALESWVVMTISGDAVTSDVTATRKVLGAIKERLWHDNTFVNFVNGVLGAAGVPGTGKQRVVEATKSFDLTYIETDDAQGNRAPVYQLTAKPISSDPATHRKWLALIRDMRGGYRVGFHALVINKRWVDCSLCKSEMHPAHSCPLPKVDGWLGPKPDNAARHAARVEKMKDQEDGGSSRGRGRGNGRARGRGRWTQVPYGGRGRY